MAATGCWISSPKDCTSGSPSCSARGMKWSASPSTTSDGAQMTAAKLLPFLLASGGLAILHFLLKITPAGANSGATLVVAYIVASLSCLAAFPLLTPDTSLKAGMGTVPWHAYAMG